MRNLALKNAKNIVKQNMVIATLDAANFNYFNDKIYEKYESLVEKAVEQKLCGMEEEEIATFALAIIDGGEMQFDKELEKFYINVQ